jgi:hypothetical protein
MGLLLKWEKAMKSKRELDQAEHGRGYQAFMRRCAFYAMAHAEIYEPGDDETSQRAWTKFHNAGIDDQPETPSYNKGWDEARRRMIRESVISLGTLNTARAQTALMKRLGRPLVVIPLPEEPESNEARNAA